MKNLIKKALLIIFSLMMMGIVNAEERPTILSKIITEPTQKIRINIEKNIKGINEDRDIKWDFMSKRIDRAVDNLFYPIYGKVDPYLDYHYSVLGEYKELGKGLSDFWNDEHKAEEDIKKRIFGEDFEVRYNDTSKFLDQEFKNLARQHIAIIDKYATENIDMELNPDILDSIYRDLQTSEAFRNLPIANIVVVGLGVKFAGKIAQGIAVKAGTKMAVKGAVKTGGALGGATSGAATGGILCSWSGPGAAVCAAAGGIIGGTIAWFGTDYVVNKGDEYFTRDDLKANIISEIDLQKKNFKKELKLKYREAWTKINKSVVDNFKNTPLSEKRRSERINKLF